MPGVDCKMPCAYRTYGKWRRTASGRKKLNPRVRDKGTCAIGRITICEKGCETFRHWDKEN